MGSGSACMERTGTSRSCPSGPDRYPYRIAATVEQHCERKECQRGNQDRQQSHHQTCCCNDRHVRYGSQQCAEHDGLARCVRLMQAVKEVPAIHRLFGNTVQQEDAERKRWPVVWQGKVPPDAATMNGILASNAAPTTADVTSTATPTSAAADLPAASPQGIQAATSMNLAGTWSCRGCGPPIRRATRR